MGRYGEICTASGRTARPSRGQRQSWGGIQSERILQQSSLGKNFTRAPGQRLQHPPQRGSGEAKGGEERLRERGGGQRLPIISV